MDKLLKQLEEFFHKNKPAIIVNTSTNAALLCLNPEFKIENNCIFMRFESLNERGGNSVTLKTLQGAMNDALYLENDGENILMIQGLNLKNYNHYIKKQYSNAPDFEDETKLKNYILTQKDYVW